MTRWFTSNLKLVAEKALALERTRLDARYPMVGGGESTQLPPWYAIVVRLDGVAFRTFTKSLTKPFDTRFTQTMQETTEDLVDKFGACLGFSISDEILLVIPPSSCPEAAPGELYADMQALVAPSQAGQESRLNEETRRCFDEMFGNFSGITEDKRRRKLVNPHIYNGRTSKITSITASYATARFMRHYDRLVGVQGTGRHADACFDARCFAITDPREVITLILWRQKFDGYRNAINSLGTYHLGHKRIQNYNREQVLAALISQKQMQPHDPAQLDQRCLFGVFVKKQKRLMEALNPKTKETVQVERSFVESRCFDWVDPGDDAQCCHFIFQKFWPADAQDSIHRMAA